MTLRVVHALGKWAIVEGIKPLVGPLSGTIDDLEAAARKLETNQEAALTAIDIYKANNK